MLLGCIADDFTGGTDLASTLASAGMRTAQVIGTPDTPVSDVDAVVVALKSRTAPVDAAVADTLAALRWLQQQGCRQFFFKYCSTFDSTPAGNIGPVIDALMKALAVPFTIACPAYPDNGRTVYQGYLFVGEQLLSESSMKDHPLTPMTDANLLRVLQAQTRQPVSLLPHRVVAAGTAAIEAACASARPGIAIVDALNTADLLAIGAACADLKLVTGGSGVALGLPDNFRRAGLLSGSVAGAGWPHTPGQAAVLAGSCSAVTNAQVAHWLASRPGFRIDVRELLAGADVVGAARDWARQQDQPVLIYSTSKPEEVREIQALAGAAAAGTMIEQALAEIAVALAEAGTSRFIIAGGETSGAIVHRLGVRTLRIGPAIDPGVPWTRTSGTRPLAFALKSGNFGAVDFFEKALSRLP